MARRLFLGAVLLLCSMAGFAQFPTPTITFRLWPNGAPTSNGLTGPENDQGLHVNNVTDPTLTVYVPKNPCGICVLDCPGGGYFDVWIGTDGTQIGLHGGQGWSKVPRIPVIKSLGLNVEGPTLKINYEAEVRE